MPAPSAPKSASIEPEIERTPRIPVWYATDRRLKVANDGTPAYESAPDSAGKQAPTRYGKALVEVPIDLLTKMRREGLFQVVSRPMEARVTMLRPQMLSEARFVADLQSHIAGRDADEREILLYVHGFQTPFEDSIKRAAVLGSNLKIATTAAFSWGSRGSVAKYDDDKAVALANVERLARYIALLVKRSGATRMHMVAHSMGNEILLRAVSQEPVRELVARGFRFGQIILAAPDVDKARFSGEAQAYKGIAQRVTLYASGKDLALLASWGFKNGFPRAGQLPPVKGLPFIETVDVSEVDFTLLGHAALVNSTAVLEDMYLLMFGNISPKRRQNLFPVRTPDVTYWRLQ